MNQGDKVIVNFPFTSLEQKKIRPALIISNEKFNRGTNVILLAIFGNWNAYSEELLDEDLEEGKLNKKSYIRFSNIFSFEKRLLIGKIGSMTIKATERMRGKLLEYFN